MLGESRRIMRLVAPPIIAGLIAAGCNSDAPTDPFSLRIPTTSANLVGPRSHTIQGVNIDTCNPGDSEKLSTIESLIKDIAERLKYKELLGYELRRKPFIKESDTKAVVVLDFANSTAGADAYYNSILAAERSLIGEAVVYDQLDEKGDVAASYPMKFERSNCDLAVAIIVSPDVVIPSEFEDKGAVQISSSLGQPYSVSIIKDLRGLNQYPANSTEVALGIAAMNASIVPVLEGRRIVPGEDGDLAKTVKDFHTNALIDLGKVYGAVVASILNKMPWLQYNELVSSMNETYALSEEWYVMLYEDITQQIPR